MLSFGMHIVLPIKIMFDLAGAFLFAFHAQPGFTGNSMIVAINILAAILANIPMFRIGIVPIAPVIIMSSSAEALLIAIDALARRAGYSMLFPVNLFAAILTDTPMLYSVVLPFAPSIIMGHIARPRPIAPYAQARFAGNAMRPPVIFLAAIDADIPMLRLGSSHHSRRLMDDLSRALLVALHAYASFAGYMVRLPIDCRSAILADEPVLRFAEFICGPVIVPVLTLLPHCAGAAYGQQQADQQQRGENALFQHCLHVLSPFSFLFEGGAPPRGGRRRPACRSVIAASRPSR